MRFIKVIQHFTIEITYIIVILFNQGLIETGGLAKLVFLHEQSVGYIQTPDIGIATELRRLSEKFFNLDVVFSVPVDFRLIHQDGQITTVNFA